MDDRNVADLRKDYRQQQLDIAQMSADPFEQFERWWQETLAANVPEPNGMTLATATLDGKPSARIVLLKGFDRRGFAFYTNYQSQKGEELDVNPFAALVFWWEPLERQVRIEGTVQRVDAAEADIYFNSRPRSSRLGAWASAQSREIEQRDILEQRQAELEAQYADTEAIPRPPHWGGYRLVPTRMEFWQGRPSRLHDRLCYVKQDSHWSIVRLSP